jgi:alkanesulfonate monooxygenase SsuD/methylene tetrahydromethanopterin reductase-like flavin-dependent oxidoreductase (luciferase family)
MHPPIWVACGNPPTFEKAGTLGIGALGFNFSPIHDMKPMIDSYKQGIANCTEPIGRYVNDNIMVTNGVLCFEDGDRARELATNPMRGYLYTLVCLYHDTFPKPAWAPVWPEPPIPLDREGVERVINAGGLLCGTPDEVCEQLKAYEETGVDQVAFGFPNDLSHDDALECIELFGTKVIPEFDKDPVHSTTRYRDSAV